MAEINQHPDFEKMGKELLKQLPKDVAQMALSHFKGSFRKQGFTDYGFVAWAQRKDPTGHKILFKTRRLMTSLKVVSQTIERIEISTEEPYAAIHNNGGKINVRVTDRMRKFFWAMYKKTGQSKWKWMALTKKRRLAIRIPQRKFIGNSHVLNHNIDTKIENIILKTFKL